LGIPQCSFYQWSRQEDKRNERLVDINEYKLRRIMRENGLYSIVVKKFKSYKPGKGDGLYAENMLQRNFNPAELNEFWCGAE